MLEPEYRKPDSFYCPRPGIYRLSRIRRVPIKEVRGLFPFKTGMIVDVATAEIYREGSFQTMRTYYELRGGKWWAVGQPCEVIPGLADKQTHDAIEMSKSVAFTSFYDWKVELSARKDLPSISITTDPIGSRELFKMREVPAGKSRRDALRNWVGEHWRRKPPSDPDDYTHVLPFLRGAQEFNWQGLYCRVHPSRHDLKKAAEFEAKRKAHA